MPPLAVPLASLSSSVSSFVSDHGLYAVFGLMLIDAVLPAASELVMVSAGALAAGAFSTEQISVPGGHISQPFWIFFTLAMAGTIGYTVGSVGGWAIGRYAGRPFVERHGHKIHLPPEKLDRADAWFQRYGDWAVFLGRVTPVVRSFVAIPAGIARLRLGTYTLLTLLGSAIWCFALAGAGWALGANWHRFHHDFRYAEIAIGVAALGLLFWLWRRRRASRLAARAADRSL